MDKEDRVKLLRYWADNWQKGVNVWQDVPDDMQVSPEDMTEFSVDCITRHGRCCGDKMEGTEGRSIDEIAVINHELEKLESEGRSDQMQNVGIMIQGSHGNTISNNVITINSTQIHAHIDGLKERIDGDSEVDSGSKVEVKGALDELKQTGRIDKAIGKLTTFAERYERYAVPIIKMINILLNSTLQ